MQRLLWLATALGAGIYIVVLQRTLRAAQLRGDMYRDIAARLDRRVADLGGGGAR